MENEPKEPYVEKTSLENNEIPPDTEMKEQNKENSPKKEENDMDKEKEDEKEVINPEKEIDKEDKEDIENKEEINDEELNEIVDKIQEEELNNQKQEKDEISHEVDEEKEDEDIKENNDNPEDLESEHNEELEDNNEEEIQENNEVEDSQQNQPEEQEQQEYKERQGIHIHKEAEEKSDDKKENVEEEDAGQIHPVEQAEENANQKEENIENSAHKEVVENEENHEQVESKEQEEEEENEVENEEAETNNLEKEKYEEPIDGKQQIYNNQEVKKLIKKQENIEKRVIQEIPRIMVFKKPKEQQTKQIEKEEEIQPEFKLKKKDYKNLVEIPKDEIKLYEKKEIIVLKGGIETGEYKFLGGETELKQEEPVAKADISKEEILSEISRRTKAEKKVSYEVVDKYYSLTVFDEKGDAVRTQKEIQENNDDTIPADNFSKYLLEQINKIRADPQSFIGVIEDAKDNIKKGKKENFYYNGNKIKVALVEGESAFNEAIEFLKSCKPMEPLIFSKKLIPPIPQNKKELQSKSYLRKSVDQMMCNGIRVNSYWRDIINDAEICFLLMIVDDNGDNKGKRRKDILSPKMKEIGISSVEIDGHSVNYFVLSS